MVSGGFRYFYKFGFTFAQRDIIIAQPQFNGVTKRRGSNHFNFCIGDKSHIKEPSANGPAGLVPPDPASAPLGNPGKNPAFLRMHDAF